jgi:hypothetical protein
MIDPLKLPQLAEERAEENFEFRQFLKNHPRLGSEQIDNLVFSLSARVWKDIDCTSCGNCCREVSPTLKENDVERMAGHLEMSPAEFVAQQLKPADSDGDAPWIMRDRPCPFLRDKRCTVYEHRPANCRDYPYLDKPDFTLRTLAMMGRLSECPAVYEVWEQLKVATAFRRPR